MSLDFFIEFESEPTEHIVPDKIRFTSSKNNHTSTLTVRFYNINFLRKVNIPFSKKKLIKSIYFIQQNSKFSTKDIQITWINGRPLILEAIFFIISENDSNKLKNIFQLYIGKGTSE
uniref:photosystem II protein psb28 n=1 Tax=Neustupella aerophytica TaxID=2962111 RepID=UPI00218210DA|nr:photosystem II protein psb28 [Neustupella aerophytica]UVI61166.1 photosystem II protein psb28 [Neustupella aerophytica]